MDVHDWENKMNDNEKYFIEHVLAFFAAVSTCIASSFVLVLIHHSSPTVSSTKTWSNDSLLKSNAPKPSSSTVSKS